MAVHWLVGISCALGMAVSVDVDGPGVGVGEDVDGPGVGVGGHGWARGRCRGGQTGVTGDGGRTGTHHMFARRSCSYGGNSPQTHHSCIQRGAQCSQWMFGNCLLYNCQPLILHLQSLYLFHYALPEQPDPFYSFPSLLLIHLICPCQQSKYLASFTPL